MTNTKEVSAGIIIYKKTDKGLLFLLLYRGGRYWNFPKGKIDEGEKSFKTAIREVWEETGILEKNLRFKEWFKVQDHFVFIREGKKISKVVTYYLAETNVRSVKIQELDEKKEGEKFYGFGWFLYPDAQRTLMHKNLKLILRRARDVLFQRKNIHTRPQNPTGSRHNV